MDTTPADQLATALSDRYRISRELGAGSMATVYLAHDCFLREIQLAARLSHPHVLSRYDSGEVSGLFEPVLTHPRYPEILAAMGA